MISPDFPEYNMNQREFMVFDMKIYEDYENHGHIL